MSGRQGRSDPDRVGPATGRGAPGPDRTPVPGGPAGGPSATVDVVAEFPPGYFLENLAVMSDGSVLVTAVLQKELWWVPPTAPGTTAEPLLVHRFDHLALGIVELAPDVFGVSLSDGYTTRESRVVSVDLREWEPGAAAPVATFATFDDRVRALNGSCLPAPGVLLLADCFAGLVWRVDVGQGGPSGTAQVWLEHPSLRPDPDSTLTPPQPGVNGLRYDSTRHHLYWTNTARSLFARVAVDPDRLLPVGEPEVVARVPMADDFCIDDRAGVAYVTCHRHNTLDRVALEPGASREVVVGVPLEDLFVGPSSAVWGRRAGEPGRTLYVTTDGGTTALPPDGRRRPARLVRVDLP